MATLGGQRAQFTWALNQYNKSEDPREKTKYAEIMAKYIFAAPNYGFTVEQVTQGQDFPSEVLQHTGERHINSESEITEDQALAMVNEAVDSSQVVRCGQGKGTVYAYGYGCCPDRLKIGCTEGDTIQRIAAQISTSTPDKPMLVIEIKTDSCRALERAIQATLETRGHKVLGGGAEWFKVSRDEVLTIYQFVNQS